MASSRRARRGVLGFVITAWQNRQPRFSATDGGYEGRAQLALYIYFTERGAPGTLIEREQKIYLAGNQEVDLLLRANDGSCVGIELKCRTKAETRQQFQQRVLGDIKEVCGGAKKDYCRIRNYVMALTDLPRRPKPVE